MATIWGLPFRVLMMLLGIGVGMLSLTGVVIWWMKRTARLSLRLAGASARDVSEAGEHPVRA